MADRRTEKIASREDLSPAVEELIREFGETAPEPLGERERRVEIVTAALFLAIAVPLAVLAPPGQPFSMLDAAVLVAAYAATSRVKFTIGFGYTVPTQLIFVPMLLLLPAPLVPLLVALGTVLGNLPDFLARRTHPSRALLAVGDSWHAVGPALVLTLAGTGEPSWSDWPFYVAALAAQLTFDFGASMVREWLWLRIPPGIQPRLYAWLFMVDVALAPIGLLAAFAAADFEAAPLLVLPLVVLLSTFARERERRLMQALELSRAYQGTTLLLSDVLEADDEYTGFHSRSVVSLAVATAEEMGLDARQRRNVEFGALLHDVGKIAMPKDLINKPGPLTPDEWIVMETHTIEGQKMLDRVGGLLSEIGQIVRSSHEHWDGSGYPDGLKGEAIPLPSAIVAAADALNAMTTDRSYRAAMRITDALAELRYNAGSQFNPEVVEVLARIVERSLPRETAASELARPAG